ncbi:secreted RxLR effector protein 161-like [Cryptomeria japonica]|uniref:secreted RxLR effector protein 161-like n=1 Tax=Cryptomeria japonica TaxID=3369 RepID=UPI0025AD8ABE|nr:secreted RxLR effector protein 161-like [Cryptomeria japonica]
MISDLKSQLSTQFEMKDLGATRYILGMEIIRDRAHRKLWISQRKYVNFVLERFNMTDCKQLVVLVLQGMKLSVEDCSKSPTEMEDMTRVPYASVVGILMYAMVCTRPDIAQAVGVLSRFMANPRRVHWDMVKRVFRYLWGTSKYSLCFHGDPTRPQHSLNICGYVDFDWAGDINSRRSTSGYVFTMFGGAVSWMSKWQAMVALSTTEVEYMTTTHACKEVIWLKRLCSDIGFDAGQIIICCDS